MGVEMRIGPTGPMGPTGPAGKTLTLEIAEGLYTTVISSEGAQRVMVLPAHPAGRYQSNVYGFELNLVTSDGSYESYPEAMINERIKDDKHLNVCNKYFRNVYKVDREDGFMVEFSDASNPGLAKFAPYPNILIKPCILNFDGSVECYLDPDDYNYSCTWRPDVDMGERPVRGEAVDIGENCVGNVMVEIPTVWIKVDTTDSRKPKFYFAKTQIDSTYHAYAHTNAYGDVVPYIYMAVYEGWIDSEDRLRSVSGKYPSTNIDPSDMISYARLNDPTENAKIWDMTAFSERMLITLLLMLNGHSTNMQDVFGNGNSDSNDNLPTGTMNTKGLFWGSDETNLGVKVFGIEHFWGNYSKWTQGIFSDRERYTRNTAILYKLTRGTQDGSTATDYNTTGDGYLSTDELSSTASTEMGFIKEMFVGDFGLLPKWAGFESSDVSSTRYYCDGFQKPSSSGTIGFGAFGGDRASKGFCGPFCLKCSIVNPSQAQVCATITCKPRLNQ